MTYQVNFTDSENSQPITVYDNTTSTDTSLKFPGRNVTGYGQVIAENFLHLLENFASATKPVNPVEGQLWYDSDAQSLMVCISPGDDEWKASGNVQRSPTEPPATGAKNGELWVDTNSQQLYIFSGTRWILVGPNFSSGLRSGPIIETIVDSDNTSRVVIIFYIDDTPVTIISKDSFTPKISIDGFKYIRPGMNVTTSNVSGTTFPAKIYGTATSADSLKVGSLEVEGAKFLRSDVVNTTDYELNVRSNSGINIGVDGTLNVSNTSTGARIYNAVPGSVVDIQLNRGGIANTTLRVTDKKVGINVLAPTNALDVDGDVGLTGSIVLTDTTESTNLNSGTIRTAGGVAITKNLLVGTNLGVDGTSTVKLVLPKETETYNLGSATQRWNNVYAKTINATTLNGSLVGDISGNSATATSLKTVSYFSIGGDVIAPAIPFDGSVGGPTKKLEASITAAIISSKPEVTSSFASDQILVFRGGAGLLKQTRNNFVGDLAVPIGAILPFAGTIVPTGYLLCDGSEVERTRFSALYDVIGNIYGTPSIGVNTFKLPDLRGRFPLGKDNMDNGRTVPTTQGNFVDAGGGNAERVPGTEADNMGAGGGSYQNTLTVANLPEHEHDMRGDPTGTQYYATRLDTAIPLDNGSFSSKGPTLAGQMQYLPTSGGVKTTGTLGNSFSVLNPFLTINYIIRSGPPNF